MQANYVNRNTFHTPVSRSDITSSASGPVKTYTLTPEELEQYRNLPPPRKYKDMVTTARQYLRATR